MRKLIAILLLSSYLPTLALAADDDIYEGEYKRATEDKDNVKEKLFTKNRKLELNLPDVGWILNTAFVSTYLLHGGLTYYPNETWGFGLEGAMGLNADKPERKCLESFYNNPDRDANVKGECGDGEGLDNKRSNYGPAYMPIREIKYLLAANAVWNPVYGKQLMLMSATSYFDVFLTAGAGIALSDFYEQRTTLNNNKKARAVLEENASDPNSAACQKRRAQGQTCDSDLDGGASVSETNSYGEAGRPTPVSQTNPYINLGVGQRFHFWKRFNVKFEFRNMLLLGTPGGFENYFAIWSGFGMRF